MVILVEFFLFLVRLILLQTGVLIAYVFGDNIFKAFAATRSPCVELLAFFIAIVPIVFLVIGAMHRRYFWQRPGFFNWIVVAVSFVIAFASTFLPGKYLSILDSSLSVCQQPTGNIQIYSQFLFTGLIVSLIAFVGMDFGVALKHVSHHLQTGKETSKVTRPVKTKSTKRTKKKK